MPKLPTRLRILNFIRSRQAASVLEMSRFLKLTGANVRHHLGVLEANALIEVVGRHKDGRGRPAQVYGLSRRVLGDNLDELTLALLQNSLSEADASSRAGILRAIAERVIGSRGAAFNGPPVQRLAAAIGWLNAHHYQAHWEATAAGPRIEFGYCPYAAVVARCPEVCELDRYILEALIGRGAEQVASVTRMCARRACAPFAYRNDAFANRRNIKYSYPQPVVRIEKSIHRRSRP